MAAVGAAAIEALQHPGIEEARAAVAAWDMRNNAEGRLAESALAEARFRAERAGARFNAVGSGGHDVIRAPTR